MISHQCRSGTPSINLSVARLVFWATVAAIRVTSRAETRIVMFCIGFVIGYTAVARHKRSRIAITQTEM